MSARSTLLVSFAASMLWVWTIGCATGPAPRPVDDDHELESGEETARQAGEAARQRREVDETVLYATSRQTDDEAADDRQSDDEPPTVDEALTIYFDDRGRFVDEDGEPVDIDALQELSDDPLQGRALRLVIDPEAAQIPIETLSPLFDAADEHGAVLDVTSGRAPEPVEPENEADDAEEPASEDESNGDNSRDESS